MVRKQLAGCKVLEPLSGPGSGCPLIAVPGRFGKLVDLA